MNDKFYISYALRLAKKGRGFTSPNPIVGALLVKNNKIIGRGWHQFAGGPHAEVFAIEDAKKRAKNSTLYVTLEPCSSYGKTPPCTDLIIKTGIKKVVYGIADPNPKHYGKAKKILTDAGIEVVCPVLEDKCRRANEAFFKWITTGMPFLTLKLALSLDAKIANSNGNSKWITSSATRKRVQKLRASSDAILIGSETLKIDHPSLTVRDFRVKKQPLRLVASSSLSISDAKNLFSNPENGGEIRVIHAQTRENWIDILKGLGKENIVSILVEGGAKIAKSLLEFKLVDKIELHYAPIILGKNAINAFDIDEIPIDKAFRMNIAKIAKSNTDFIVNAYF